MHTCPVHGVVPDENVMLAYGLHICGLPVDGEHMVMYKMAGDTAMADGSTLPTWRGVMVSGYCGEPLTEDGQ